MAQNLGAEVVKLEGTDVAAAILRFAEQKGVSLLIAGQSTRSRWYKVRHGSVVASLVNNSSGLDVLVVSFAEPTTGRRGRDAGETE
jgi:two-component system sensor histidine kinase KdpD